MTTSPVMGITDELLAELEEAAKAATPGPWFPVSNNTFLEINTYDSKVAPSVASVCASQFLEGGNKEAQNGLHIARANPATVLALIARIRELDKALRNALLSGRGTSGRIILDELHSGRQSNVVRYGAQAMNTLAQWGAFPDIQELRQRNAERIEQARQIMGRRHLLHPDNRVRYINVQEVKG